MDVHERIYKALSHEEPDRVPTFSQSIEDGFIQRFDESPGVPEDLFDECIYKLSVDLIFAKAIGLDSKWVHLGTGFILRGERPKIPPLPEGQTVNNTGQIYASSKTSNVRWYHDGLLGRDPDLFREWLDYLKDAEPPPPDYYDGFARQWEFGIEKGILPIPTIGGPVWGSISAIGLRNWTKMARKYPNLVKELIELNASHAMESHSLLFETGVDMVFTCDDFAQKGRLLISPRDFEKFFEPVYKKIAANAHKHGAKYIVHTDGNITDAIPAMIRAGIDAIEPLEYESGMRLKPLKERFGDKMAFIGNVPASDALCVGTVDYVVKMTKQCIKDAAEGGGLVLAPGANILHDAKVENVLALVETTRKYGVYPISF